MPPAPIGATISYGPSLCPLVNVISASLRVGRLYRELVGPAICCFRYSLGVHKLQASHEKAASEEVHETSPVNRRGYSACCTGIRSGSRGIRSSRTWNGRDFCRRQPSSATASAR